MSLDDYSDSDDSDVEEVSTNVLLGLPDGPITSISDLNKPRISRIGGLPVYPSGVPKPNASASLCQTCSEPMELLVQLWCPFESSAYDRTLHIWGCSKPKCQRKEGSVKAIRALRFNAKYAAKLEAKKAKEAARSRAPTKVPTSNPFSVSSNSTTPQLFGVGWGDDTEEASIDAPAEDSHSSSDPSSESEDDGEDDTSLKNKDSEFADISSITSVLKNTTLNHAPSSDSTTLAAPSYSTLYLDTTFEYIASSASDPVAAAAAAKLKKASSDPSGENQWSAEGYEKMAGIDEVFERFVSRVENEPQQCIRYDLSGIPLPFATESVYKKLFPPAHAIKPSPGTKITVTGGKELSSISLGGDDGKRTYDPSAIPPCEACGSPRVFECQLMPNLINVLQSARRSQSQPDGSSRRKQTDEERRAEVARLLKGEASGSEKETDMEWGTCLIFSCLSNCCRTKNNEEIWVDSTVACMKEYVLVQWDV